MSLQSILKTIPDIIFRLDSDDNFSFISPAISKYLKSPEVLLGRPIFELVAPEDLEKTRYRLNETFSVTGELSRQTMLDNGAERELGQSELIYKKKNYTLRTGLRQSNDQTSTGENNRSTQLLNGESWQATKRLTLRLNREQSIFNEDDSADFPNA